MYGCVIRYCTVGNNIKNFDLWLEEFSSEMLKLSALPKSITFFIYKPIFPFLTPNYSKIRQKLWLHLVLLGSPIRAYVKHLCHNSFTKGTLWKFKKEHNFFLYKPILLIFDIELTRQIKNMYAKFVSPSRAPYCF